ncbi:shikimate dehydrogenase [Candidatus Pelagibacter sp.]|jgi:shikimate dehydrogenase|nr:shikimate dehydrogenase [Candidatus Pelagibacter sp.]
MKKFLVVGNPIGHSLSPTLHNYWIKSNSINAIYEKQILDESGLEKLILDVKEKKINGINVTVPFKQKIIPYLDELSLEAERTQSVNTIYLKDKKAIGHNTDIIGFKTSIEKSEYNLENKKVLILGAGGVVPSIIFALTKMKPLKITITNRTKEKAENLKKLFKDVEIIEWGKTLDFDMIINATSLGLKKEDILNLNFTSTSGDKFFYDVIYNPSETNFLKIGRDLGKKTLNGKLMFIYQALSAFHIWHGLKPDVDEKIIKLLDK